MTHELKVWPVFFDDLVTGKKSFEFRVNDRNFQLGDILHLKEFIPIEKQYTNRSLLVTVTYILNVGPVHSTCVDSVIMSIR